MEIIFAILLLAFSIWGFFQPEKSYFYGKKWVYGDEPTLSKNAIFMVKAASVIASILLGSFLLIAFFEFFN